MSIRGINGISTDRSFARLARLARLAWLVAQVEVDFLEQAEVLPLLQQHMGLRLGGPGRAPGSRRVVADVAHGPAQPSKPSEPSEPAVSSEPSTYDAVVQLAGATGKLKLRAGGCLLVERAKSSDGLELTDLTDLGEEPETSESALFLEEPLRLGSFLLTAWVSAVLRSPFQECLSQAAILAACCYQDTAKEAKLIETTLGLQCFCLGSFGAAKGAETCMGITLDASF